MSAGLGGKGMEETKAEGAKGVSPLEKERLRSVSDLLKDAWTIFVAGWVKFLLYFAMLFGVIIATIVFVTLAVLLAMLTKSLLAMLVVIIVGVVIAVIVFSVFALATNKLVYNVGEKNDGRIKAAIKYGFQHFPSYILVMLASGILIVVGFILLVIPGIIIGVMLSLVAPIFVLEENHKLNVLKRSRELVRGYWWPVFGRLVLLSLISGIASSIRYINPQIASITLLLSLVAVVINFILTYYGVAYIYLIYKDLAKIKKADHTS